MTTSTIIFLIAIYVVIGIVIGIAVLEYRAKRLNTTKGATSLLIEYALLWPIFVIMMIIVHVCAIVLRKYE
jgi:hypothetical protein